MWDLVHQWTWSANPLEIRLHASRKKIGSKENRGEFDSYERAARYRFEWRKNQDNKELLLRESLRRLVSVGRDAGSPVGERIMAIHRLRGFEALLNTLDSEQRDVVLADDVFNAGAAGAEQESLAALRSKLEIKLRDELPTGFLARPEIWVPTLEMLGWSVRRSSRKKCREKSQ